MCAASRWTMSTVQSKLALTFGIGPRQAGPNWSLAELVGSFAKSKPLALRGEKKWCSWPQFGMNFASNFTALMLVCAHPLRSVFGNCMVYIRNGFFTIHFARENLLFEVPWHSCSRCASVQVFVSPIEEGSALAHCEVQPLRFYSYRSWGCVMFRQRFK